MHIKLNHFTVYLKLIQHCKPTIFQKKNKLIKEEFIYRIYFASFKYGSELEYFHIRYFIWNSDVTIGSFFNSSRLLKILTF